MRQLISEILKFIELELVEIGVDLEIDGLVTSCDGETPIEYTAVDSGYVVRRVRNIDVLIQSLVAVGRDIKRRFIIQRVEDPHREARENEIHFAEELNGLILLDGPLTPYRVRGQILGVSKEPMASRYGPNIPHSGLRDVFIKMAKMAGEVAVAARILRDWPAGSYLRPVDVGEFYGTFVKSSWVIYVEFPKNLKIENLCKIFIKYPIKLRLAHHLSKVNRKYLNSVKFLFSTIGKTQPRPREFL